MNGPGKALRALSGSSNLGRLYYEIREEGPIKKSRVGLDLSVSKPTRYALISSLTEDGLVEEVGDGRGEPPTRNVQVDIVADLMYSIGIDLQLDCIHFILLDLRSSERAHRRQPLRFDPRRGSTLDDRAAIIEGIRAGLLTLLRKAQLGPEQILSVGVSDCGMIDAKEGVSLITPEIPGWVDVPLRRIVQSLFPVPVYLGRDANLAAIAEIRALKLKGFDDLLCVTLRRALGLGILMNGHLYTGHTGNAGEWCYTAFSGSNGREGRVRNLESVLSLLPVVEEGRRLFNSKRPTVPRDLVPSAEKVSPRVLFKAYERADKSVSQLLDRYIDQLGLQLANLIYLFDPAHIVLSGWFVLSGDRFIESVARRISDLVGHTMPFYARHRVSVLKGRQGEKAPCWGAAYMSQEMLLGPEQHYLHRKQEREQRTRS